MQLRAGTCAVTNGSANVIAASGVDWSLAGANSVFAIVGAGAVLYTVATTTPPGSSVSGFWELTLTANYAGTTNAATPYAISVDFTPTLNLAIPGAGDVNPHLLWQRNFLILDQTPGAPGEPGADSTVPGPQGEQGEPGESPPPPPSIGIEGGSALLVWHGDAIAATVLGTYRVAKDCQLTRWQINAQDAPVGANLVISGTKNASPFADLITLPAGDRYEEAAMASPLTLGEGDVLVFTFDQAGSTTPGQNLMIHLQLEPL